MLTPVWSLVDAKMSWCGIRSCLYGWLPEEMQQEDAHACFDLLFQGGEKRNRRSLQICTKSHDIYPIIISLDGDTFIFVLADVIPGVHIASQFMCEFVLLPFSCLRSSLFSCR